MTIEVVGAGTRRRVAAAVVGALVALACVLSSAQAQQRSAPFTLYAPLIVGAQPKAPQGQWSWSAPIAVSADGSVWVVNPDAGSVTQLDAQTLVAHAEIPVGREPWSLAISANGATVYVVDRAAGALVVVDARAQRLRATLPVGPEPAAVALSPDGFTAFVSVSAADALVAVDTARLVVTSRVAVARARMPLP